MEQLDHIERIIQEGDLEALSTLLNKLKTTTNFDEIYDTANLLSTYGFLKEANALYELLLVHLPDEAQLKIDRATILIELGEEDEALLLLKEIQKEDEEYVQALLVQADYYQMTGLLETAVEKIKEAYQLFPTEPIIQFAYAELLLNSGRYAEAANFYLKLKDQVEMIGEVNIVSRLAETYSEGGAYEEALPYYEALLQERSAPDTLFGAAFAHYQVGNAKQAIQLMNELIAMDPDYYAAYMLAGQAHLLMDKNEKAYELFKAGIARDEFDKELHLSAGKCALKLGLQDEAEQYLSEALVLDPEYIEALITLASLYNETEQDEALIELVTGAVEEVNHVSILYAFLAYSYERMELYEKAYDAFQQAYDGMNDDYEFLNAYASFLLEEGRKREAIEIATVLIRQFPDDQNWHAFLELENDMEV